LLIIEIETRLHAGEMGGKQNRLPLLYSLDLGGAGRDRLGRGRGDRALRADRAGESGDRQGCE
jgi:hypothetical protein